MHTEKPLPCDAELRVWHQTYASYNEDILSPLDTGLVENQQVPYYGSKDLRELREADLLGFVSHKCFPSAEVGRRQWKNGSGYHRQGTVENAFFR